MYKLRIVFFILKHADSSECKNIAYNRVVDYPLGLISNSAKGFLSTHNAQYYNLSLKSHTQFFPNIVMRGNVLLVSHNLTVCCRGFLKQPQQKNVMKLLFSCLYSLVGEGAFSGGERTLLVWIESRHLRASLL